MILTRNMFNYFSCYFDIDQGHSDRLKWCVVQTAASPGKPCSIVKTRSEMGCRFSGSDLKRGMKNHIFWSEIGSGFWEPCGTPPPKIWGSTPKRAGAQTYTVKSEAARAQYVLVSSFFFLLSSFFFLLSSSFFLLSSFSFLLSSSSSSLLFLWLPSGFPMSDSQSTHKTT